MSTTPTSFEGDYLYDYNDDDVNSAVFVYIPLFIYIVTFLVGISGNSLVIWIVMGEIKKTTTIIWILNLSLADLTFTSLLPFSIAHQALKFHWPFGQFLCKLICFIIHLSMFTSVLTLSVTSINRCLSVVFPIWSQNNRSKKFAVGVCAGIWFLAFVVSLPFYFIRDTEENLFTDDTHCFYKLDMISLRSLILARFALAFLLPFITLGISYSVITFKIRHRYRRHRILSKAYKIVIMIISAFLLCWIPFHILNIISVFTSIPIETWLPLATSLAYVYSCVNPILYLFTGNGPMLQFKNRIQTTLRGFQDLSHSGSRSEYRGGQLV